MAISNIHKGKYIFHFTDLRNLDSIVKNALLSTNEKKRLEIKHHNIANQTIQARRDEMDVTVGPGGKIHDYVPFYFSSINPMLLSLLNHKNCDQNLIVYLCINIERLDRDDAVFTNSSANTNTPPIFYDDTTHLDELDWDLILSRKWKMDSDEAKHKKMAEALIHTKIDICEIDAIVVYNDGVKKLVEKVFKQNGLKAPDILFEHDYKIRKYGFYYTKFFFDSRKNETLVIGPQTLLHVYKELLKQVKDARRVNKKGYHYKTIGELVEALNQDINCLPEMRDAVKIHQNYDPHNDTVGHHTEKVVAEIRKCYYYKNASKQIKNVMLLGAYLHDMGKGPASKWKNGQMKTAYLDHPADAIPMLRRILAEEIETISDDEIRRLCMLVVYHDIIGDCLFREREKQQIADLIESEDDYDMLSAISIADATSTNGFWGRMIGEKAPIMKAEVMNLKQG